MKSRTSKIFRTICILFAVSCILLSAYLTADVWARYFTGTAGGNSAKVAKFDVSVVDFEGLKTATFASDHTTETYSFKVLSDSKVAVEYDVILEIPAGSVMPEGVTVSIDGKTADVNGNVHTFSDDSWTFAAGENERTHEMRIDVYTFDAASQLNDIKITVIASQID